LRRRRAQRSGLTVRLDDHGFSQYSGRADALRDTDGRRPDPADEGRAEQGAAELKDLPSGFSLEPEDPNDESTGTFSSASSKCKTLVKYLNSEKAPGSKTSAARSFSGSQEGPYIDFGIDSMVTTKAVRTLQTSYKQAVESCKKVTLRVPGQGSSPMQVVEIPPPNFGEQPFAFKLTGTAGPLEGRELTAATTGIGDVILSVSILAGQEGELDGATEAAVDKARTVLAGS